MQKQYDIQATLEIPSAVSTEVTYKKIQDRNAVLQPHIFIRGRTLKFINDANKWLNIFHECFGQPFSKIQIQPLPKNNP
jgi:hypothetical protein